jgi:hypothetical protein
MAAQGVAIAMPFAMTVIPGAELVQYLLSFRDGITPCRRGRQLGGLEMLDVGLFGADSFGGLVQLG